MDEFVDSVQSESRETADIIAGAKLLSKSNEFSAAPPDNTTTFAQSNQFSATSPPSNWGQGQDHENQVQTVQLGKGENAQTIKLDQEGRPIISMPPHARPLPVSPSYFSRQPQFNDSYLELQRLYHKYSKLPTAPADQREKVAFRSIRDYKLHVGEDVKAKEYSRCISLVKALHKIHPDLQSTAVKAAVNKFKRAVNPYIQAAKPIYIDKFGRSLGVGRRKTSVARAWIVEGTGEVLINGKNLADAFGRIHDRESAVWPLQATQRMDKYNVWALVEGGGTTGQAEALTLAIAKALILHEPALKPALRRGEAPIILFDALFVHDADMSSSWVRDQRSQGRGEEEAWPSQGKEEACVGQEIDRAWNMHMHNHPIYENGNSSDSGNRGLMRKEAAIFIRLHCAKQGVAVGPERSSAWSFVVLRPTVYIPIFT